MKMIWLLIGLIAVAVNVEGAGVADSFASAKHPSRQALRGDWKFVEGTASCVSDPELYKKFKNHGPILRWPVSFTDGVVEFSFRPQGCERIVITLNEDGHVFRIALSDEARTRIFGWVGRSSKTNKPKTIAKAGVPTSGSLDGRWVKVRMKFAGSRAEMRIGDYTAELKHASIGRKKGEFTLSFAGGSLAMRDVRVVPAD